MPAATPAATPGAAADVLTMTIDPKAFQLLKIVDEYATTPMVPAQAHDGFTVHGPVEYTGELCMYSRYAK
tara:strand:+ start:850 stop:1059 length:210 start_codon:yes stop_codon:yes gene_type:complete